MSNIYDKSSLVLIPSGTKTGKVYSQKPVSGDGDFTFTRSSAATRVNADGNIEKETQNLFSASNDFDNNTYWSFSDVSVISGQSGYDGTNDAFKIVENTASGQHIIQQSELSVGVVQCVSVYAKAAGRDWLMINQSGIIRTYYDLANGVMGSIDSNVIDATITDVGGGWYRCTYTAQMDYTGLRIGPTTGNGANLYTGDGTSGVLIQDAQLEQGLVARDYIETTTTAVEGGITDNVPRLDYTDSSCPALLLEPQRTNLFDHSEYFNTWSNAGTTPVFTNNYGTSPEGLQNSTRVQLDNSDIFYKQIGSSQGAYVFSVFAKAISGGNSQIILRVDIPASIRAVFDLSDGTIVTSTSDGADIIDYGNGWYRCILIQNNDTIVNAVIEEYSDSLDCEMYGAQLEEGSYATSYIPTYGSSVTRVADNMDTTFSSPIPTTGNVSYFIHLDGSDRSGNATAPHATIRFAGNDYITYNASGGGYHRFRVNVDGTANYYTGNLLKSQEAKLLAVINGNYIKIFMNGQQVNQGTLLGTPNMISATGYTGSTSQSLGPLPIKELLLISTALTDQEAIDLTTI